MLVNPYALCIIYGVYIHHDVPTQKLILLQKIYIRSKNAGVTLARSIRSLPHNNDYSGHPPAKDDGTWISTQEPQQDERDKRRKQQSHLPRRVFLGAIDVKTSRTAIRFLSFVGALGLFPRPRLRTLSCKESRLDRALLLTQTIR